MRPDLPTERKNNPFLFMQYHYTMMQHMLKMLRCAIIHPYKHATYRKHKGQNAEFTVSESITLTTQKDHV
jgi:hypothetical protein